MESYTGPDIHDTKNNVNNQVNSTGGSETTAPTGADLSSTPSTTPSQSYPDEVNSDLSEVGKSDQYIWGAIACYLIYYKKGDVSTTLGWFILVSLWLNKK